MGKKYDFDYIVIGSGPAGSAAALNLAKAKKNVAIVEGNFYGGANLNSRDVPYSVALDFSHTFKKVLSLPEFKNQDFTFSLPTVVSHQLETTIRCGGNDKKPFKAAGVTCIDGYASFLDQNTITVNGKNYTAHYFILATGAKLKTIEIAGTETVKYLTPETAIKSHRLPKVVVIVGGGVIKMAESRLFHVKPGITAELIGLKVESFLREDKEVSEVISNYFTRELGIMILTGSKVVALGQDSFSKQVIFVNNGNEKMIRTDCIVLATGSQPVLDYGLENAGVKYKNSGIIIDKFFETSAKNIYAIGDCLGKDSSTDLAEYEGTLLASNIVNKTKTTTNYHGFTRITNTYPTVAVVGLNEDDLIRRDRKFKTALIPLSEIPAGNIYGFNYGFIKIIADKANHIIGGSIVAPNAELLTPELATAIRHNLTAVEVAGTPHITNSYNYAIKLAAKQLLSKK